MEEQPGPPLNHEASGAVAELLRASKNLRVLAYPLSTSMKMTYQNHMFMFDPTERYPEYWFTPGVVSQIPEFLT